MHTSFSIDDGILLGSALVIVGIVVVGMADRRRFPGLVLFLAVGMVVADDGLGLVHFADTHVAQNVAVVALVVILFEGGLATSPQAVRRAGVPAVLMATVGMVVTAAAVAAGAALVFDVSTRTCVLIGAVVASTDAAAIFSALRGQTMPARVRDLLQLESGLNDPVGCCSPSGSSRWRTQPGVGDWVRLGLVGPFGGAAVGLAVGMGARAMLRRLRLPSASSYPVLALGIAGVSYGLAAEVGTSGAVPIVLATIPVTAGYPDGSLVFNVVFVVVLASLVVQAGTLGMLVKRLGFTSSTAGVEADVAVLDALVADLVELRLTGRSTAVGRTLRDLTLPPGARVAFAVRDGRTFVPDGDTKLADGDGVLLAVAPDTDPDVMVAWAVGDQDH